MGNRNWAKQLTGKHFLLNGLYARNLFVEIVWTVKIIAEMANLKKPADFTHIFSVSTIDAILLLRHAFSRQDMYDIPYIGLTLERFCGVWVFIQLKKYTTFYYMTLSSFL